MLLAMSALDKGSCCGSGLAAGSFLSCVCVLSSLWQAEWSRINCAAGAEPVTLSGDDGEQLGPAAGAAGMR